MASSLTASGTTLYSGLTNAVSYYVESLYPGAGYNAGTLSNGNVSGNSVTINDLGFSNSLLTVNQDGTSIENFKTSFLTSSTWIEDVINTGSTNVKSAVIKGYLTSCLTDFSPTKLTNFTDSLTTLGVASITGNYAGTVATYTPKFLKLINGTYSLAGGSNGTSTDNDVNALALIGDPTVSPKTGLYALDNDSLNISIACAPGFTNQYLHNAGITLAEQSQNFIWLTSPPYGTVNGAQGAIDWSNGQSETRSAPLNSSYAACHAPWLQVYSVFNEIDMWLDPVIYAARQMCYTDSVSEPWYAPAGYVRGRLTKPADVEVVFNQGDRDSLYSGGNIINPIVKFPQQGIVIFGQRTCQRNPTALDRINVRRLLITLRKLILASTNRFAF
jgi:phage tail sheath protein FI